MKTFKKKSFFKRALNDENRACAAYCLGLMGNKDVLPLLHKAKESKISSSENTSILQLKG